ncbi:DUF742 domain-containing protein [Nocardia sp. CDC159]|uniref:DUF742 domain-containing protein n=1 Tax=Nocardia pulmonis TaxID=2951408 RepID=A0A9X2IZC7_9NOCA|nr:MULTISPECIES: DUF742 domain-containing protein [Nocardia]MCM6775885.1 DUF742 domain-containing protein [Nocardia pulmonis]MCM6788139.1 DUF742 domain-containing protein [Nocardia sp. CDC159]
MNGPRESWYEEDAGPLVRLYAVTRGRGRVAHADLTLATQVVDARIGAALHRTEPEYAAIVRLCRTPQSVAEVAARLRLPLTLVKVLIGDLIDDGRLRYRSTPAAVTPEAELALLQAVLHGIRAL